jgi:hypothetical protein
MSPAGLGTKNDRADEDQQQIYPDPTRAFKIWTSCLKTAICENKQFKT